MTLRYYQEEAVRSLFDYFGHEPPPDPRWPHGTVRPRNPVVGMPTGTGKSVVIAEFVRRALSYWPDTRVIVLTHVKELISQNAAALQRWWPDAPVGVYSAGLRMRDTHMPIIFGGIASVHGNVEKFGKRDLILIDECHLLSTSGSSMYQETIADFAKMNPFVKVIGFSATPYRMGQGKLTDDGLFTDFCYDITGLEAFNRLISEGYLSPPYIRKTDTVIDTTGVSVASGEFAVGALEKAASNVTIACLQEMCYKASDCRAWLIFAAGIDHAESMAKILNSYGIPSAAVHSRIADSLRQQYIADFKAGKLRCLVNQNVLTTGFDYPPIDFIGMMRPTMSTGLWVQMIGRGTRPWQDKRGCLVLDFAGNTRRLGPVNDPYIPTKKGGGGGDAPVRLCASCGTYCPASARACWSCGEEFGVAPVKLAATASTEEVLKSDLPIVETIPVTQVFYSKKQKTGMPPYMLVSYSNGIQGFHEFVCLEHTGRAGHAARQWWRERHNAEPPATIDEALTYQRSLRVPRFIRVVVNKRYPEVIGHEY